MIAARDASSKVVASNRRRPPPNSDAAPDTKCKGPGRLLGHSACQVRRRSGRGRGRGGCLPRYRACLLPPRLAVAQLASPGLARSLGQLPVVARGVSQGRLNRCSLLLVSNGADPELPVAVPRVLAGLRAKARDGREAARDDGRLDQDCPAGRPCVGVLVLTATIEADSEPLRPPPCFARPL